MAAGPSFDLPRPFGPYELVRRLAKAGDAEVFLARARSVAGFEKAVALKMINPALGEDAEFARLLVEEANIASQLSHKNVVQVIDLGQIDGLRYIAMEYVDGVDLGRLAVRLVASNTWPLSPRVAAYVLREICEGLDHAHRKCGSDGRPLRIVHRDVSPSNILLSFSGEVKLTDFGIARASLRAATQAGTVKGRYGYMAPEQVRGGSVDARADVFAAGLVLYEMITGQPAYLDGATAEVLEQASQGRFAPAESLRPDLPASLLEILKRATMADPARRYPTARALAEDLTSFLYTVQPNPEMDLARLLEATTDASRNVAQPLGALLVDDSSEEVTQIETAAAIRNRILDTRTADAFPPVPAAAPSTSPATVPKTPALKDPPPRADIPQPASLAAAESIRASGGIARVRGRVGRSVGGFNPTSDRPPPPPTATTTGIVPPPPPDGPSVPVPASPRKAAAPGTPVLRGSTLAGMPSAAPPSAVIAPVPSPRAVPDPPGAAWDDAPTAPMRSANAAPAAVNPAAPAPARVAPRNPTPRRPPAETLPEVSTVPTAPTPVVPDAPPVTQTTAAKPSVMRAATLPPTGMGVFPPAPMVASTPRPVVHAATLPPTGLVIAAVAGFTPEPDGDPLEIAPEDPFPDDPAPVSLDPSGPVRPPPAVLSQALSPVPVAPAPAGIPAAEGFPPPPAMPVAVGVPTDADVRAHARALHLRLAVAGILALVSIGALVAVVLTSRS